MKERVKLRNIKIFLDEDLTRGGSELRGRRLNQIARLSSEGKRTYLRGEFIMVNEDEYQLVIGKTKEEDRIELVPKNS